MRQKSSSASESVLASESETDNGVRLRAFQTTKVESQNTTTDFIIKRVIATHAMQMQCIDEC
jgi:hypothetical protein